MHLCLTIDGAAAMSSDTQTCLGSGGRAEPDCGDLPRSGLADREEVELLRCRDATEIGAPFKFRRYGYGFFNTLSPGCRYTLKEFTYFLKSERNNQGSSVKCGS